VTVEAATWIDDTPGAAAGDHPNWMISPESREVQTVQEWVMADLIETFDLTAPSQNGWTVDYRIRRADGEELHAEVRCWDRAFESAERAGNAEALDIMANRGLAAALEYAETVQSPAGRGSALISIWFDVADNGSMRRRVSYERTA
jgi:hypothetical protein